ncbi:MAG: hypothetical protein KKH01_01900 [Firmicutes bacterium]|nr:hypothetical protein [Bacillota bacterium]
MRKKLLLVIVLGLILTLSACSNISQEDYNTLISEKNDLESEVDILSDEKSALQNELDSKMVSYKDQTVEAYQYTHGGYVGQVVIVVEDGVLDVEINEAFMPHTLAEVTLSTLSAPTDWNESNTLVIGYVSYALYISYNDAVFKALQTEAGLLVYSAVDETGALKTGSRDIKNLDMDIIKSEANMKAYYDELNTGGFKLLKSFGDTSPIVVSENLYKDGNSNYWQASEGNFGWQANIDTIEAFLEENGAAFDTLAFTTVLTTLNGVEDTYWQVADMVTGATNSSFQEYFLLAQTAFGKLETEVK